MKVALCTCIKLENRYLREFVDWYKQLGINKIFLYDNNELYGEHPQDIIQQEIDNNFIELINWRGKKKPQCKIEQDCWDKHHNEFDWICFFDCDEYLTLRKDKSINDYLSRTIFDHFDIIHINFLAYGDNENLEYENKKLLDRFPTFLPLDSKGPLSFPNNCHIKSIIKGTAQNIGWLRDGHTPVSDAPCCSDKGIGIQNMSVAPIDYEYAYIRHYSTKTITEYITTKFKRGDVVLESDGTKISDLIGGILTFFSFNTITNEKIDIVKSLIKEQYETKHNIIVVNAGGRIGNMLFTLMTGAFFALCNEKELYVYVENQEIFRFSNYWHNMFAALNLKLLNHSKIHIVDNLNVLGPNYVTCYEDDAITYTEIPNNLDSNLYIKGYRQSPKYWENQRQWVIKQIQCPNRTLIQINENYKDIDFYKCISINVRRGDYVGWCEQIYYLPSTEWYINAANEIDPFAKCIITSDDIEWCKQNFIGNRFIFIDKKQYSKIDNILIDLFVQTKCMGNVISCSTFSWWGAYLNEHKNRKVIYHSPWMKTSKSMDIIPKNDNWSSYESR